MSNEIKKIIDKGIMDPEEKEKTKAKVDDVIE